MQCINFGNPRTPNAKCKMAPMYNLRQVTPDMDGCLAIDGGRCSPVLSVSEASAYYLTQLLELLVISDTQARWSGMVGIK